MRILIDTNIFIPSEDSEIELDSKLAELHRLISGEHQLLVHPSSREDILRDKNEKRRSSMLQRLDKYIELTDAPQFSSSDEEIMLMGAPRKANDSVDNLILLSLHKNCVHWLITHDEGLRKKAKRLGDYERVLTVEQAIAALLKTTEEELRLYPNISNVPCHSLDVKNVFFDSLRLGYSGFDEWFSGCSREGRYAWVCKDNDSIHAIAIYKHENNPVVTLDDRALRGNVLKLCTFKVLKKGFKIGELLLKQAFNYASDNSIEYVYCTVAPGEHEMLEDLLVEFGFYDFGTDDKGRDRVFVKSFPKILPDTEESPLEYAIKYYPAIKLDSNNVFLIPIQPQYHEVLFPELVRQSDLFSEVSNSAGNAIKQAYLCRTPTRTVKPGDIVFFYRTTDDKTITTYGIVDQFYIESEVEKIFQWVSKRTVYSYSDIKKMSDSGEVKVILFRLIKHLKSPISFLDLKRAGIVKGSIQSLVKLDIDQTKILLKEAAINDCLLPN